MYIPAPGRISGNTADWATKMAKYWQTNAGYIKKEIKNLENDKYSMIITRHPVDVMRMADFNNITSCHSPPSRDVSDTSYYKCAVAEAKGHGAVAYVVETEDLLHLTNTGNIESAEQEIQEGEIFYDELGPDMSDYRERFKASKPYSSPSNAILRHRSAKKMG